MEKVERKREFEMREYFKDIKGIMFTGLKGRVVNISSIVEEMHRRGKEYKIKKSTYSPEIHYVGQATACGEGIANTENVSPNTLRGIKHTSRAKHERRERDSSIEQMITMDKLNLIPLHRKGNFNSVNIDTFIKEYKQKFLELPEYSDIISKLNPQDIQLFENNCTKYGRLYNSVKSKGGFMQVQKNQKWGEIWEEIGEFEDEQDCYINYIRLFFHYEKLVSKKILQRHKDIGVQCHLLSPLCAKIIPKYNISSMDHSGYSVVFRLENNIPESIKREELTYKFITNTLNLHIFRAESRTTANKHDKVVIHRELNLYSLQNYCNHLRREQLLSPCFHKNSQRQIKMEYLLGIDLQTTHLHTLHHYILQSIPLVYKYSSPNGLFKYISQEACKSSNHQPLLHIKQEGEWEMEALNRMGANCIDLYLCSNEENKYREAVSTWYIISREDLNRMQEEIERDFGIDIYNPEKSIWIFSTDYMMFKGIQFKIVNQREGEVFLLYEGDVAWIMHNTNSIHIRWKFGQKTGRQLEEIYWAREQLLKAGKPEVFPFHQILIGLLNEEYKMNIHMLNYAATILEILLHQETSLITQFIEEYNLNRKNISSFEDLQATSYFIRCKECHNSIINYFSEEGHSVRCLECAYKLLKCNEKNFSKMKIVSLEQNENLSNLISRTRSIESLTQAHFMGFTDFHPLPQLLKYYSPIENGNKVNKEEKINNMMIPIDISSEDDYPEDLNKDVDRKERLCSLLKDYVEKASTYEGKPWINLDSESECLEGEKESRKALEVLLASQDPNPEDNLEEMEENQKSDKGIEEIVNNSPLLEPPPTNSPTNSISEASNNSISYFQSESPSKHSGNGLKISSSNVSHSSANELEVPPENPIQKLCRGESERESFLQQLGLDTKPLNRPIMSKRVYTKHIKVLTNREKLINAKGILKLYGDRLISKKIAHPEGDDRPYFQHLKEITEILKNNNVNLEGLREDILTSGIYECLKEIVENECLISDLRKEGKRVYLQLKTIVKTH